MSQTLLNYRLAGVDKDDATRAHLRELSDKATEISLTFAKHVQENVNRVEVRDAAELDGSAARTTSATIRRMHRVSSR